MKQQNDPTPAALYARVSSNRQDVDLSVSAQLRALRGYAETNGYIVAREYVDEAESGRIADRPQFRKMLDEASKPTAPFHEILGGYVNRCVNDIRRRPSQPLIQWRFHPHTVHRDRRLRSTQGPSDA